MDESWQKRGEHLINYFDYINKSNKAKEAFYAFISIFKKDMEDVNKSITNTDIESTTLFNALDLLLSDSNSSFCKILNKGDVFYRARIIDNRALKPTNKSGIHKSNDGIFYGFDEANSKEPPIGISPAGRNNYIGASYLYLSENAITATAEVNPMPFDLISIAKFKVNRKLRIIDFSHDASIKTLKEFEARNNISASKLITLVMQQFGSPIQKPEEYAATQYISDLIRKMGYDGIKYKSSKTGDENLTIFTCHKKYISYIDSTIMLFHGNIPIVYDINTNEKYSIKIDDIDEIAIEKLKRDLSQTIH